MVASFIIFVRGVEEVGKEEDWLNSQRLFISPRRDGGREHWVRTLTVCYTLSGSPPTPPLNLSAPPLPHGFYVIRISPEIFITITNFIINHLNNKQILVGYRMIIFSARHYSSRPFFQISFWNEDFDLR